MEKKVTLKEIAEMTGVSKTTVSFYINGKFDKMSEQTKTKLNDIIKKTGYKVNKTKQAKKTNKINDDIKVATKKVKKNLDLIGVILKNNKSELEKGIENYAFENGYSIVVNYTNKDKDKEKKCIDKMKLLNVKGILIEPIEDVDKLDKYICSIGMNTVFIENGNYNDKINIISSNEYDTILNFIETVYTKYKNFIIVTDGKNFERYAGIKTAILQQNLNHTLNIIDEDMSVNEIGKGLKKNIDLENANLIFVPNEWALAPVFEALKKYKKLMPNYISLVGFNNLEYTNLLEPTITTIVEPTYEKGEQAVSMMIDIIQNNTNDEINKLMLKCYINYKQSILA